MCFGVAPSIYRSVHAAPILQTFEPSPWHVAANGCLRNIQLLGKHFLRLGRPRPKEPAVDSPQPSWADFHASCHSGQNCRH